MNDIRRAIAYAATRLSITHASAELLPGRVLADLWEAREHDQRSAAPVAAPQEDQDGDHDPNPTS